MSVNAISLIAVGIGGSLGAISRFLVVQTLQNWLGSQFPYGTLTVNVIGSFIIGFLTLLFLEYINLNTLWRLGVIVGFLGAFTTFSSFSLDTIKLIQQEAWLSAFLNIFFNVLACLTATWLGMVLAKSL